jgi:hypothetical protein
MLASRLPSTGVEAVVLLRHQDHVSTNQAAAGVCATLAVAGPAACGPGGPGLTEWYSLRSNIYRYYVQYCRNHIL